nr:immunoglobulin light chain junction region [Macaca mulatta]
DYFCMSWYNNVSVF